MNNFISLSCPHCGGKLEITPDLDRFACGYCGREQIVNRGGGVISLSLVSEAISGVKEGTDKTAAELALIRLQKDYDALCTQKQNLLSTKRDHIISTLLGVGSIGLSFVSFLFLLLPFSDNANNICLAPGLICFGFGSLILYLNHHAGNTWESNVHPQLDLLDHKIEDVQNQFKKNQEIVSK